MELNSGMHVNLVPLCSSASAHLSRVHRSEQYDCIRAYVGCVCRCVHAFVRGFRPSAVRPCACLTPARVERAWVDGAGVLGPGVIGDRRSAVWGPGAAARIGAGGAL